MINWPPNLIEDLAARRAVIFFGSGTSRNSTGEGGKKPETWWKFLEALKDEAKKLVEKILENKFGLYCFCIYICITIIK